MASGLPYGNFLAIKCQDGVEGNLLPLTGQFQASGLALLDKQPQKRAPFRHGSADVASVDVRASTAGRFVPGHRTSISVKADDAFRWQEAPNNPPELGWADVLTPLGASVHVPVDSLAWDLCTDWLRLNSGRGALWPTDPVEWFDEESLAIAPAGLVAELLASGGRMADFTRLLADSAAARAHILGLPDHVFGADPEEWLLLGECMDIARLLHAREAARSAAAEALGDIDHLP